MRIHDAVLALYEVLRWVEGEEWVRPYGVGWDDMREDGVRAEADERRTKSGG